MKKIISIIMVLVMATSICSINAFADEVLMDDFTSYGTTDALKEVWAYEAGDKLKVTLEKSGPTGSAMNVVYPDNIFMYFANLRKEVPTELPEGAIGIEFWARNLGDAFVLLINFRDSLGMDYYAKTTITTTSSAGKYFHIKFAEAYDGNTRQPSPMEDAGIKNIGISIATGEQPDYKSTNGITFSMSDMRAVTEFDTKQIIITEIPTESSSQPEESEEQTPVSSNTTSNTESKSDNQTQNTSSSLFADIDNENDGNVLPWILVIVLAITTVAFGAGFVIVFVKLKKLSPAKEEKTEEIAE